MIKRVVIPTKRRQLIRDLSKSYMKEDKDGNTTVQSPWNASTVKGKGGGLVFLLHGKPGIGKTYTAECVAEYTRRPLLSLSCADIGTEPDTIENNLTRWFKRGRQWGAIMLVDEADVYMERRITQDLGRNALVAGFLRALEYYNGLLFLTTNRVGSFDDAFVSRIHVSLYYPDFSDDDRALVWQNFCDKLSREREETIRVPIDTRDYTSGAEVRALKWNGREIGNAFQTAVALAEVEGDTDQSGRIIVKQSHLQ
ncbi:MAG: hypothetical protein MMC23_003832 [Stictis urceolatum]|nr:hypothetical protein [Stictis urceolata]